MHDAGQTNPKNVQNHEPKSDVRERLMPSPTMPDPPSPA